jgi:hypothetical protein
MNTMINKQNERPSRHTLPLVLTLTPAVLDGQDRRRCRSWCAFALILLAAGAMILTLASGASAGTYVIDNCPAAGNGDAGSWAVFGSPQNVKGSCGGGPGDYIGPRGDYMSPGTTAGVQIGAPSGITILTAKVWWQASQEIAGATTFAIAADNDGAVTESLTPMTGSEPSTFVLPSTTTEITLANYCSNDDAGAGCTFGSGDNNILELYGAQLTLDDTTLPTGTVTGGALPGSQTVSGTTSISYQAADSSSGVRLVQLRVDGEPTAEKDYLASCSYTNFQACPPNISDTLSWNTTTVANGQHRVELLVQDAAQNTRVIYSGQVTVQNGTTSSSLGALPGPGSTNPSAGLAAGSANGTGASEKAELRLGLPSTITRSYAHRAVILAGRLLNEQGLPIQDATLDVLQQVKGTSLELIGRVQTNTNGTFSTNVPAGPSRLIEIAYRAFSNDSTYTTTAGVNESVEASVRLHVKWVKQAHNPEGTIELYGTVNGPIPQQGTIVELLVHYRGHWEPFRTPRTNQHGRFHVLYQFEGGVGRFPFRAEIPGGQTGFPFSNGDSRVVNVRTG